MSMYQALWRRFGSSKKSTSTAHASDLETVIDDKNTFEAQKSWLRRGSIKTFRDPSRLKPSFIKPVTLVIVCTLVVLFGPQYLYHYPKLLRFEEEYKAMVEHMVESELNTLVQMQMQMLMHAKAHQESLTGNPANESIGTNTICDHMPTWVIVLHLKKAPWTQVADAIGAWNAMEYIPNVHERQDAVELQIWVDEDRYDTDDRLRGLMGPLKWGHGNVVVRKVAGGGNWVDRYVPSPVMVNARRLYCRNIGKETALAWNALPLNLKLLFLDENKLTWSAGLFQFVHNALTYTSQSLRKSRGVNLAAVSADALILALDIPTANTESCLSSESPVAVRLPAFERDGPDVALKFPVLSMHKPAIKHQSIMSLGVDARIWDGFHRFYHMLKKYDAWWTSSYPYRTARKSDVHNEDSILWIAYWHLFLKNTGAYMLYPRMEKANSRSELPTDMSEANIRVVELDSKVYRADSCSSKSGHPAPNDVINKVSNYLIKSGSTIIAMAFVNRAYHEVLMSWYCNVQKYAIKPQALVIFVSEPDYAQELNELGLDMLVIDFSRDFVSEGDETLQAFGDLRYGMERYWHLMFIRSKIVNDLLSFGMNVLVFDLDQAWLSDPLKHIDEVIATNENACDLVGTIGSLLEIGGNFLYFPSTFQGRWLARAVLHEFASQLFDAYGYVKNRPMDPDSQVAYLLNRTNFVGHTFRSRFTSVENDQSLTSDIALHSRNRFWEDKVLPYLFGLPLMPVRWLLDVNFCAMPKGVVVDGKWFSSRIPPLPVVINNNYIFGLDSKIRRAKRENLWFWDESKQRCL